jgi:phosphoribosylanthranilate isomerase
LLARVPSSPEFWLAGGLTPDNVMRALVEVRPAGVDVATGVEAAIGRKDTGKIQAFIAAVRGSGQGVKA